MPSKGQILTNPLNGDIFEYLETSADSKGERVVIRSTLKTKGKVIPDHIHQLQDETFEVVSGRLTVWSEGETSTLSAGEKITLPRNKPHNHFNDSDAEVVYIHTITPGLDFDYLIENLVGLAADGKSRNGKYGLIQELVMLRYLDSKTFLADIPPGIQKALMHTVAPAARLFGYRALYRKYGGMEK